MVIGEVLKVEVANPTVYKEKVPNLSVKVKKPKIKFKNV
jgi:hypothetical protein